MSLVFMFEMIKHNERLARLEREMKPSYVTEENDCNNCGFCCFKRPPIPNPEDLKVLADHFNMTETEFINTYCTIDTNDGILYYPKIAGVLSKKFVGRELPAINTWNEGQCIFLSEKDENNKYFCTINDVKPSACRSYECWNNHDDNGHKIEWKKGQLTKEYGVIP